MIDVQKYNDVVDQLLKLPRSQRNEAMTIFVKLIGFVQTGTAEITLSRQQFADQCGMAPRKVSSAMTILEGLNVIRREFDGRGVTYFVSPLLIWNGDPERHKAEAEKWQRPSLHVVEGGVV